MFRYSSRMLYVYALVDPTTKGICYIGLTANPGQRLKAHINEGKRLREMYGAIGAWIASLHDRGLVPEMIMLDQGDDVAMIRRETELIRYYRSLNPSLCNICDGSVGARGRLGVEPAGAPPMRGRSYVIARREK